MYGAPYTGYEDYYAWAGIITLREGFEAALVVVLVLAFVNRTGERSDLGRSGPASQPLSP